ncbi:MAG: formate dehydrogenase accessory sulfurtransferase FdhD [Acidobacteriota bacterium]|nr:formate dehydrogenase accessory sulfurtransferase FdhD [Acidobacteriota bacterium]
MPVRRFGTDSHHPLFAEDHDFLVVEEPLQIRVGARDLSITMRTPGNDGELAAGFLCTEGIVQRPSDIASIQCQGNVATVTLTDSVDFDLDAARRNFYITSSCGVCGKTSIEALEHAGCTVLPLHPAIIAESVIRTLPAKLRESQQIFNRTGGLHAAGLFSPDGELLLGREDVGRHNAMDKLIGRAFLDGELPLHNRVLLVSGRVSFELVQKAAMAGIPVLAAVGAPSSLAVRTALRFGMTLIGFVREERYNVYSAGTRLDVGV